MSNMKNTKKKIAVVKLGGSNGRICFGKINKDGELKPSKDITSGCTEAKTVIGMLERSGKFDITVITKVLDGDYLPDNYSFYNILDLANENMQDFLNQRKFDYMFVINGSINAFGGAESSMIPDLCIYKMMHYFSGKIFYCQCDLALNMLNDIYEYISGKEWCTKYNRDEYDLTGKDITLITQAFDIEKHLEKVCNEKNYKFTTATTRNFPFEKYPCIMPFAYADKNDEYEHDLSYGGTLRGGKRVKNIVKWYFNQPELDVLLYGKLEDEKLLEPARKKYGADVKLPTFSGTCNFVDNAKWINKGLATIVIGDDLFEKTATVQQRAYQAMCARVVTFIDTNLDKHRRVFAGHPILENFSYVTDPSEIASKIKQLKDDPKLRDDIITEQNKIIGFDVDAWVNDLAKIVIGK